MSWPRKNRVDNTNAAEAKSATVGQASNLSTETGLSKEREYVEKLYASTISDFYRTIAPPSSYSLRSAKQKKVRKAVPKELILSGNNDATAPEKLQQPPLVISPPPPTVSITPMPIRYSNQPLEAANLVYRNYVDSLLPTEELLAEGNTSNLSTLVEESEGNEKAYKFNTMTTLWRRLKAVAQRFKRRRAQTMGEIPRSLSTMPTENYLDLMRNRLKVFIGTWNMNGQMNPDSLYPFLEGPPPMLNLPESPYFSPTANHPYHLVIIGTQECGGSISRSVFFPDKTAWEKQLVDTLGPCYLLLTSETMAAMYIAVFAWRDCRHLFSEVQTSQVKTGLMNGMVGNKGAVAVSLKAGKTSMVFVNAHLAAHQQQVKSRNADIVRIDQNLRFQPSKTILPDDNYRPPNIVPDHTPTPPPDTNDNVSKIGSSGASTVRSGSDGEKQWLSSPVANDKHLELPSAATAVATTDAAKGTTPATEDSHSMTEKFDRAFWFGDLNYRVDRERNVAETAVYNGYCNLLLKYEQLRREMSCGRAFLNWREAEINFAPTFKFDLPAAAAAAQAGHIEALDVPREIHTKTPLKKSRSFLPPVRKASTALDEGVLFPIDSAPISGDTKTRPPHRFSFHLADRKRSRTRRGSHRSYGFGLEAKERLKLGKEFGNIYDTSPKKRVPSWCDRILYRTNRSEDVKKVLQLYVDDGSHETLLERRKFERSKDIIPIRYDAVMELKGSDHKPVVGVFLVKIEK